MTRPRSLWLMALAVVGLLGAHVGEVAGQPASRAELSLRIESGHRAYAAGRFDVAAHEFLTAHSVLPIAELLFNAAGAYEAYGKSVTDVALAATCYEHAATLYARYAAATPAAGLAARIAALEKATLTLRAPALPKGSVAPLGFGGDAPAPAPLPLITDLVIIESTPSGLAFDIDQVIPGGFARTPWIGRLASGRHVMMSMPGYVPYSVPIAANAGGLTVVSVQLVPVPSLAYLHVNSSSPGADVYLDDRSAGAIGVTPHTLTLTPGRHTIFIVADGYAEVRREVEVVAGEAASITVKLEGPPVGYLMVHGDVSAAHVHVDGALWCEGGPCRRPLPPGTHDVQVARAGARALSQQVSIVAGTDTRMTIDLAARRRRWDAIAAAALAAGFTGAGVAFARQDGRGYPLAAGAAFGLGALSLGAAIYAAVREHPPSRAVISRRSIAWLPTPAVSADAAGLQLAGRW
jgi:hypothetical protein